MFADLTDHAGNFVRHLYGLEEYADINQVRHEMFKTGKSDEQKATLQLSEWHYQRFIIQCLNLLALLQMPKRMQVVLESNTQLGFKPSQTDMI